MNYSIPQTFSSLLIAAAILSSLQTAVADDLFSEVTIGSVFESSTSTEATSKLGNGRRLSGVHSIKKAMAEAGLRLVTSKSADAASGKGVTVAVSAPQVGYRSLNFRVALSRDKESVIVSAALARLDSAKAKSATLVQLIGQSAKQGIRFAYSNNTLRIESTFENMNVSPTGLKSKIDDVLDRAAETASSWKPLATLSTTESRLAKTASPSAFSLAGNWSTDANQKTNYGIRFEQNRFKLGIVANGSFSKTEGTWSIAGNSLTLNGDGLRLSGSITVESTEQFVLTINSQQLKFIKSKK